MVTILRMHLRMVCLLKRDLIHDVRVCRLMISMIHLRFILWRDLYHGRAIFMSVKLLRFGPRMYSLNPRNFSLTFNSINMLLIIHLIPKTEPRRMMRNVLSIDWILEIVHLFGWIYVLHVWIFLIGTIIWIWSFIWFGSLHRHRHVLGSGLHISMLKVTVLIKDIMCWRFHLLINLFYYWLLIIFLFIHLIYFAHLMDVAIY